MLVIIGRYIRRGLLVAGVAGILASCANLEQLAATPETIVIRFAFPNRIANYEPLVKQFEDANPQITIQLEPYNQSGRIPEADVLRATAAGVSPDQIANLLPLDELLAGDRSYPIDDLLPGTLEALQTSGRQLGIPAGLVPMVMYYRTQPGIDPEVKLPGENYTLDDFLAAAQQVNQQGENAAQSNSGLTYGFCTAPQGIDPVTFAYLFGGKVFDRFPDPTQPTLNVPDNVRAIVWYAGLWKTYTIAPPKANLNEVGNDIEGSKCGFWLDWYNPFLGARGSLRSGMLPLPKFKTNFDLAYEDSYFLLKGTPHIQEAWQWMSFIGQNQAASGVQFPVFESQITNQTYLVSLPTEAAAIATQLSPETFMLGLSWIANPQLIQIVNLFDQAVEQVVDGKEEAQVALDKAQQQADLIFSGGAQ